MGVWAKASYQGTNLFRWLARVAADQTRSVGSPIHIMFCLTDHYEPASRLGEDESHRRHDLLLNEYPKITAGHKDHDGIRPTRTWFYPPHHHKYGLLKQLVGLCDDGYGEIEFHLHHGKAQPDDEANLRQTIQQTLSEYSEFGIFGTQDGVKRYGFIHGDWALDNSRRNKFCGVNSEITVLKDTGCYADFTFPSPNESSPRKANSIYYATDDPARPKSYNTGIDVQVGVPPSGDLMIVEGPTHPYFIAPGPMSLRVVGDVIDLDTTSTPKRIDGWVRTAVHVVGKRDWVFIKTHTHGATDAPVVLGEAMEHGFSYMEEHYNDGKNFCLHYVTAREMYNIIKAAEKGEPGKDPSQYRDYLVTKPKYRRDANITKASATLDALIAKTYRG